jgi:hypothetical protein
MKGIRKYDYSALLMLSAPNLDPTVASAQDEGGRFSLPHGVHWKDAIVPAGDYRFTVSIRVAETAKGFGGAGVIHADGE